MFHAVSICGQRLKGADAGWTYYVSRETFDKRGATPLLVEYPDAPSPIWVCTGAAVRPGRGGAPSASSVVPMRAKWLLQAWRQAWPQAQAG